MSESSFRPRGPAASTRNSDALSLMRCQESRDKEARRWIKSWSLAWGAFAIAVTGLFLVNCGIAKGNLALSTLFATIVLGLVFLKLGRDAHS